MLWPDIALAARQIRRTLMIPVGIPNRWPRNRDGGTLKFRLGGL